LSTAKNNVPSGPVFAVDGRDKIIMPHLPGQIFPVTPDGKITAIGKLVIHIYPGGIEGAVTGLPRPVAAQKAPNQFYSLSTAIFRNKAKN